MWQRLFRAHTGRPQLGCRLRYASEVLAAPWDPGILRGKGCQSPATGGRRPMRIVVIALLLASSAASAQTATTCKTQAADKKLSGAALTSFTKKCEKDAQTTCDVSAKEKKLAGAAKTSFTKKCVSDAVGT